MEERVKDAAERLGNKAERLCNKRKGGLNMTQMNHEEMNPQTPMTAHEISGELMEDAAGMQAQEAQESEAAIREGVASLFEDGWTGEELSELSQDMGVREDVARGMDVVRAACKYLRAQLLAARSVPRRRGVPIARAAGGGAQMLPENRIEAMSDAQFEAFSRQAREAAMMGRKVKM